MRSTLNTGVAVVWLAWFHLAMATQPMIPKDDDDELDKVIALKLSKVTTLANKIDAASDKVVNVTSQTYPGSPAVQEAAQELKKMLSNATAESASLQMSLGQAKAQVTNADARLAAARAASKMACGVSPCDIAASQVAESHLEAIEEMERYFAMKEAMRMRQGSVEQKKELDLVAQSITDLPHRLLPIMTREKRLCKGDKKLTKCQLALNTTVAEQYNEVLQSKTYNECKDYAEKLSFAIKRAEELLRPLELGEMKLFTDSVASRRDVRDHGTLRANNAAFPAATALLRGTGWMLLALASLILISSVAVLLRRRHLEPISEALPALLE
ncbi:unnamed protein product [Durusdinium trenchii]|uniref:Uncharacterized protein n=2 Tax=Durusdinium trenchii TaxID=1381693 RepID=A0ABP0LSU4_9DINO